MDNHIFRIEGNRRSGNNEIQALATYETLDEAMNALPHYKRKPYVARDFKNVRVNKYQKP